MNDTIRPSFQQPVIVRYVEAQHSGIHPQSLTRNAIGYIVRGTKQIYEGDTCRSVSCGDVFYLSAGIHYVEHFPDGNRPFEQILFYYSPADLQRILMHLNITYGMTVSNRHSCERCNSHTSASMPAWSALRNFFTNTNGYLRDDDFHHDTTAEKIKMTELVYLIASHEECCLKSLLLSTADTLRENFEQVIYGNIFRDIPIEELARATHRSLTSFKKEFRRHFQLPPHKWFIHQRLMRSRLLLISTSKSISEIGNECTFPNTSHFIKLFKKEYKLTPAAYRHTYHATPEPQSVP